MVEPSQLAIVRSYSAVVRKTSRAKRLRSSSVKPPDLRAAIAWSYWLSWHTTATEPWFLAAPRNIDGPPISICSMHSAKSAPDAMVAAKG